MGEMNTEVDDSKDHQCIEEVHDTYECLIDYTTDCLRICDCEDIDEVADLYGLHSEVEGEEHQCWCKVDEEITEVEVEDLHFEEEISHCHSFTC